jgi:hypothetical protein
MRGDGGQSGVRRCRRLSRACARGSALALALAAGFAGAETPAPQRGLAPDREISPSAVTRKLPDGVKPPKLDGRLNDPAWQAATKLGVLTQQSPHEGAEPTYPTDVWVLYDDENIYVGVRAWDPEPEKLIAKVMRRDTSQRSDDRVLITIDTFHDKRNGYMFSTNPLAARWEALIENNQTVRQEWDGIWNVKARVDAEGWTCEFVFPLKTLSFAPDATSWGFNVARSIKRINEESRWASWRQNKFPLDMSEAGTLSVDPSDARVEVGRTLDVVPYGALGGFLERNVDEITTGIEHRDYSTLDGGLDAFYRLTPSVTGALTFNTDFSDSDVDARQVNLDRFALFFPETRDFFLQDAGIFDFGGIGEQIQFNEIASPNGMPFFTRKVGIYSDPIGVADTGILDIRAGAKVTGRVGRLNFGVMNVQLEDFELQCELTALRSQRECGRRAAPSGSPTDRDRETNLRIGNKNLSVARAKWNLGAESTAGVIATYGDPNSPGTGHTLGVDFRLRSSHVRGHQVAELIGWAQTTRISGQAREFRALVPDSGLRPSDFDSKRDQAFGLRFRYPNDHWFVDASWTRVGDDFTPTLGFVNRTGIDHLRTFTRRRWRPASGYVRNYDSLLKLDYFQGLDGHMQTLIVNPTFLEIHNALDDFIYLGAESRSEVISDSDGGVYPECRGFYINETPLICIPAKRFDWRRVQLGFGMAQSRPVALFLDYSYGGFFGGKLHSIEASAELRLSKHFYGQVDYIENRASSVASELCLPACARNDLDFVQRLVRLRAQLIFTPDVSWDTFVQYDNLSDGVGWNSRLRLILQPGNELVIIWNQAHGANDVEGRDFRFQSAGLTSKLSWTFRF